DVQRRDDDEGHDGGHRMRHADAERAEAAEERLDEMFEGRLAHPAEGQRGEGDGELRGAEVAVETLGDAPRHPGARAPVRGALGPLYEAKTHDKVVYNFGASNALARQIRAGAPVDVFFSADEATMDTVPTTARHDILGNRLLILGDLRAARRVALANPAAVP